MATGAQSATTPPNGRRGFSLRLKMLLSVGAIVLTCVLLSSLIQEVKLNKVEAIFDASTAKVLRAVRQDLVRLTRERFEKSLRRLVWDEEFIGYLRQGDRASIQALASGVFISYETKAKISLLAAFDRDGRLLSHITSDGVTEDLTAALEGPAVKGLLERSAASSAYESAFFDLGDGPRLGVATSILDENDRTVGYLFVSKHPFDMADELAKRLERSVAIADRGGALAYTTHPELFDGMQSALLDGIDSAIIDTPLGAHKIAVMESDDPAGETVCRLWIAEDYGAEVSAKRNLTLMNFGSLGIMLAVSLALLYWIMARLLRPLMGVIHALQEMALGEGDLTRRISAEHDDEIGDLARGFNLFVEKIQQTVRTIAQSAATLSASSQQLVTTARDLDQDTTRESDETEKVAGAINEMSDTITDISAHGGDLVEASKESVDLSIIGKYTVEDTAQGIQNIAKMIVDATTQVEELGGKSEEIGSIVSVINEISEQTNLLALNAAIEAARAGAQGRGFAVVAEEVRRLAEKSTSATAEISKMIEGIQSGIGTSVANMESGKQEVEARAVSIDQSRKVFDEIVRASEDAMEKIQSIASDTDAQSETSRQMRGNMESITAITRHTSQMTSEIHRAADDLANLADELSKAVAKFKIEA